MTTTAETFIPRPPVAPDVLYMRDAKGRLVPTGLVRPQDALEDQTVRKLMRYADDLSAQIARFKAHSFDDVGAFLALLAEDHGAKRGGTKGNITLTSYDGTLKVQIAVSEHLSFGPGLQVAKTMIDELIAEWAEGANDKIRALVEHAFRVDKEGQVSREAIFALRRVDIDDDRWRSAMTAIADSVRTEGSKTYMRFYRRDTPTARWTSVPIDIAAAGE